MTAITWGIRRSGRISMAGSDVAGRRHLAGLDAGCSAPSICAESTP